MRKSTQWILGGVGLALAVSVVGCGGSSKHAAVNPPVRPAASVAKATTTPPTTTSTGITQPSASPSMTPCGVTGAVCPVASKAPAGWGTYRVTDPDRGTVYTISIRPGLDNAEVQQVQEFRRLTNFVKPVNYVTLSIDNASGSDTAWFSDLSIVSAAGKTYKFESASDEIDAIQEGIDNETDAQINAGNAVSDADWSGNGSVLPGAKSSVLMIGGPDMPVPGRVFLDGNEAFRVG